MRNMYSSDKTLVWIVMTVAICGLLAGLIDKCKSSGTDDIQIVCDGKLTKRGDVYQCTTKGAKK